MFTICRSTSLTKLELLLNLTDLSNTKNQNLVSYNPEYRASLVPGSWFLGYRAPLVPDPGVPSTTSSWFLMYRAPLVPDSLGTKHHQFLVPGVLSTTSSWFLGDRAPLVPDSWGTEHHQFLVPGVPSTPGS